MQSLVKRIKENDNDTVKLLRKKWEEKSYQKKILIAKKYKAAWEKYKLSKAYKRSSESLLNRSYSNRQPYIDNVIERIFNEGFFLND